MKRSDAETETRFRLFRIRRWSDAIGQLRSAFHLKNIIISNMFVAAVISKTSLRSDPIEQRHKQF